MHKEFNNINENQRIEIKNNYFEENFLQEYHYFYENNEGSPIKIKNLCKKYLNQIGHLALDQELLWKLSNHLRDNYNNCGFAIVQDFFESIVEEDVYKNNDKGLKRRVYKLNEKESLEKLAKAYGLAKENRQMIVLKLFFYEILAEIINYLKNSGIDFREFLELKIENFDERLNEKLKSHMKEDFSFRGKIHNIFYAYYALNGLQDKIQDYLPLMVRESYEPVKDSSKEGETTLVTELKEYVRKIIPSSRDSFKEYAPRTRTGYLPIQQELQDMLIENYQLHNFYEQINKELYSQEELFYELGQEEKENPKEDKLLNDLIIISKKVEKGQELNSQEKIAYIVYKYEDFDNKLSILNNHLKSKKIINESLSKKEIIENYEKLKDLYM